MQIGNGGPYGLTYDTSLPPEEVLQRFYLGTTGASEYTVAQVAPGTLLLTRRFWPMWVIVLAVLGTLLCVIGVLLLLYRETETLEVTVTPTPTGSSVSVRGFASNEMAARLQVIIANLASAAPVAGGEAGPLGSPVSTPPAPGAPSPQGEAAAAGTGPAAARLCPAGHALAGSEQFCPTCGAPVA